MYDENDVLTYNRQRPASSWQTPESMQDVFLRGDTAATYAEMEAALESAAALEEKLKAVDEKLKAINDANDAVDGIVKQLGDISARIESEKKKIEASASRREKSERDKDAVFIRLKPHRRA